MVNLNYLYTSLNLNTSLNLFWQLFVVNTKMVSNTFKFY